MIEEWRDIPGATGYQVSSHGRVRSVDRVDMNGSQQRGKILTLHLDTHGYLQVTIRRCGERIKPYVHSLVLESFVGPRPEALQACHWNGARLDNRPENLRWGTRIENAADRERHGMTKRGENAGTAKLTESDVLGILKRYGSGERAELIAASARIHPTHVRAIVARRKWGHLKLDAETEAAIKRIQSGRPWGRKKMRVREFPG